MRLRGKIIALLAPGIALPLVLFGWLSQGQLRELATQRAQAEIGHLVGEAQSLLALPAAMRPCCSSGRPETANGRGVHGKST